MFKSFHRGTFKEPPQFSNENTSHSVNDFCDTLLCLDAGCWDWILGALELPKKPGSKSYGLNNKDLCTLSAYQGDLLGFLSPAKGSHRL